MSARIRDVRLGPFGLVAERRPDGMIYARSPHPLGEHPARLTERLEHWAERAPERTFLARRDDGGRLAAADLRPGPGLGAPDRAGAARSRAVARAPARDSLGQRPRARAACARRPARGRAVCPDLARLLAGLEGFRQAPLHHRSGDAGAGLRRLRLRVSGRDRGRRGAGDRARGDRRATGRAVRHAVRRAARARAHGRRRGGRGAGRAGYHRQAPVHLRLDRHAQGGDQHPAHAVQQPGDDPDHARVLAGRAAGDGRLAALAPHRRRQPQHRPGPVQRRLAVHRRRQAHRRRDRPDRAQPARDRDQLLCQRAQGLRGPAAVPRRRCGIARAVLQRAQADVLRGRPSRPARLGGPAAACAGGDRRAHPDADRPGRDRDRAVRVHARQGGEPRRRGRPAGARDRAQARAAGWREVRRAAPGTQRHARATGARRR